MSIDTGRFKVKSVEKISSATLATFSASVNTAIAAGKLPVSEIYYEAGTTTYTVMFATLSNRKEFPKYIGGSVTNTTFVATATAINNAAGTVPTVLCSRPLDAGDNVIVMVANRTAS